MTIAFSVPSGYHARELLLPLRRLLETDPDIQRAIVITPAAPWHQQLFPDISSERITFVPNPEADTSYRELFQQTRPDLVITDTNGLDSLDLPILRAARQLNIRTLTFIASWDNIWKIEQHQRQRRPLCNADYFVVWNKMMRRHLQRIFPAIPDDHVSMIGPPRFDYFHHRDRIPSRAQIRAYLNFPDDDRPLLHFATTELYPMDYLIATVRRAIRRGALPESYLYASVHPGGDLRRHRPYAQRYGVTIRYSFGRRPTAPVPQFRYCPTEQDIYRLAAVFIYADVLINHSSTVALESFAGDTPVINVKYGRPLGWWRWYRSVVYRDFQQHYRDILADAPTTVVANPRTLLTAIRGYLSDPAKDRSSRQKNLRKMTTHADGTASQRMLTHIKQLASARP